MGQKIKLQKYQDFLTEFDKKIETYFSCYKEYIQCKPGCSKCCENGDYPLSNIELQYLMQGFINLDDESKKVIQANKKTMKRGGKCPFLVNNRCSVYSHRPIVCRVHGLAYLGKDNIVILPDCANIGKNFSSVYSDGEISIKPVLENLDTPNILKQFEYGEIRTLYDWFNS